MTPEIYDISVPISPNMVIWPGDPKVTVRQVSSIAQGSESNVSQIRMSVHTGTHIDAPKHFLDEGKTIEHISMQKLTGRVFVMAFNENVPVITEEILKQHPKIDELKNVRKVLFKTRNSKLWHDGANEFREEYVGLDHTAAQFLVDLDMALIGVDYLSIAPFSETKEPHKILLEKEVVLLEGIDLSEVQEGFYELYCLPLLLHGCEGSPARVILISRERL